MNPLPPAPSAGTGLRGTVLYVEDNDVGYELVAGLLADHEGLRLQRAATGQAGVEAARAGGVDVVLLDMNLPDISGVEVVRRLSEEIAQRRFRVLLLTADSLNIDVLKAMSLGAFEYLVKPVRPAALLGAIGRALAPTARG